MIVGSGDHQGAFGPAAGNPSALTNRDAEL